MFKLFLCKHLLIVQTLLKAVPESLFRRTDFVMRALAGFLSKPFVYCESGFWKPLRKSTGGFQAYRKGFHINSWLAETRYKLSVSGFSKVLHK
jgi:hypothetical protein